MPAHPRLVLRHGVRVCTQPFTPPAPFTREEVGSLCVRARKRATRERRAPPIARPIVPPTPLNPDDRVVVASAAGADGIHSGSGHGRSLRRVERHDTAWENANRLAHVRSSVRSVGRYRRNQPLGGSYGAPQRSTRPSHASTKPGPGGGPGWLNHSCVSRSEKRCRIASALPSAF